jgi:hypothetical protein
MTTLPDSDYFGDLIRVTLQKQPDGFQAKGTLLAPPIVGWQVCAQHRTALGAVRECFRLAENLCEQELVRLRVQTLLEESK